MNTGFINNENSSVTDKLFSLLRGTVFMQVIEILENALPQISTIFQGLGGIFRGKVKITPTFILYFLIKGEEIVYYSTIPFPSKAGGLRTKFPSLGGRGKRGGI